MTAVKTLSEIVTMLKETGKLKTLKELAKAINYDYPHLSTIRNNKDKLNDDIILAINDHYKTQFVKSYESDVLDFNCAEIVNKLLSTIEELQKQNSLLIDKILKLDL
jgi:hypothetical protein